jgi:hypothetical protein
VVGGCRADGHDLKAVNPNNQADEDTRTPAELLDIIEQKGREVAAAVAVLRAMQELREGIITFDGTNNVSSPALVR